MGTYFLSKHELPDIFDVLLCPDTQIPFSDPLSDLSFGLSFPPL